MKRTQLSMNKNSR